MSNLRKDKLKVIKFLNELSQGIYPEDMLNDGMCCTLDTFINKVNMGAGYGDDMLDVWANSVDPSKWDKFSGHTSYPIPDPNGRCPPSVKFYNIYDRWGDHEYGDLRREYCKWYADQLKIKLNGSGGKIDGIGTDWVVIGGMGCYG